jgi:hypothetical protein
MADHQERATDPAPPALAAITGLSAADLEAALDRLVAHDVLVLRDEVYVYTVELIRRWVGRRSARDTRRE